MNLPYQLSPRLTYKVIHVGHDREPVLVIDDLLDDPEALVRHAASGPEFRRDDSGFYPGIRTPLDSDYAAQVFQHLQQVFLDTFSGGRPAAIRTLSCLLSLTTTRQEHLRPIQSVPHVDSYDGKRIAGVHYLCGEEFGGTSFYRHRSTGFELMDAQRTAEYAPRLKQEVMDLRATRFSYIRGDTTLFERTGGVDARFNRAVFYRSNVLHSGDIAAHRELPADPRTGRLTANTLGLIQAYG